MILRAQKPQVLLLAATAVLASVAAQAAVTISTGATKNIVCSAGVCTPTHKSAVLNARDLQTMLGTGNVTITTGSGSLAAQTSNIVVASSVTWTSTNALTLDAYESVTINAAISVAGTGGVSLTTNDGGTGGLLSFGPKGNVVFGSLTSSLTINGVAYTLVANIATLASDIAANASGNYALAADYNAKGDGTYPSSAISTTFNGIFEGLGNTISLLLIRGGSGPTSNVGMFAHVGSSGTVADLRLTKLHTVCGVCGASGGLVGQNDGALLNNSIGGTASGGYESTGGFVGVNNGTIRNAHSTTNVESGGGGLVAENYGSISNSYTTGSITGDGAYGYAGLVHTNFGSIDSSFATGVVSPGGGDLYSFGGLVDINAGSITNSYSTGVISNCYCLDTGLGGLVGENEFQYLSYGPGTISSSYSTRAISSSNAVVGGLVAYDQVAGDIDDSYWDTTTSGVTNPAQGAGNIANDPGITGLTTSQLQSGLPTGFDPAVWGQNPSINGGLPYLLANPPP